jgi:hypothetical protein
LFEADNKYQALMVAEIAEAGWKARTVSYVIEITISGSLSNLNFICLLGKNRLLHRDGLIII